MVTISGETASLPPDKVATDGELGEESRGTTADAGANRASPDPSRSRFRTAAGHVRRLGRRERRHIPRVAARVVLRIRLEHRNGPAIQHLAVHERDGGVLAARGKVTKPKPRLRPVCLSVMTCVQEENSVLRM
jgi:hypothetical protein